MWTLVDPCDSVDIGSQRCRLPRGLFIELDIKIGSFVRIKFPDRSVICRTFVWKNQTAKYFLMDRTVTLGLSSNIEIPFKSRQARFIPMFLTAKLRRINVTVVLSGHSYKFPKTFLLRNIIRDVLNNLGLTNNCTIHCKKKPVCKLMGISKIVVNSCSGQLPETTIGTVNEDTDVIVEEIVSEDRFKFLCEINQSCRLPSLGGLDGPLGHLEDLILMHGHMKTLGLNPQQGVLIFGPPGTGKTSLVRTVARRCRASLVEVQGPNVCRPHPGESELTLSGVFDRARALGEQGPCVLLFDEADSFLAKKNQESENSHGNRLVSHTFTLMDGLKEYQGHLLVVATTNRPNALDPAFRRQGRFDREIYIGPPTKDERMSILQKLTEKLPVVNLDLREAAELTPGYVGADLALLCHRVANLQDNLPTGSMDGFRNALRLIRPSTQRAHLVKRDFKPVTWDDIGGLEQVKVKIKQAVEWPLKHSAAFERLGLPYPKGVLLYGPPGCCKTTLVKAAATACRVNFVAVGAAEVYSAYVGESSKVVSEVFHQGRLLAPAIIFLDELDALVGKRSEKGKQGVHEKILSTLLNEMDGIGIQLDSRKGCDTKMLEGNFNEDQNPTLGEKYDSVNNDDIIVIGATNRPDLLDRALLRPGRFDKLVYVPPPDLQARQEILQVYTRNMPLDNVNLQDIATKTEYFTGADLKNVCKEAALRALTDDIDADAVKQSHFDQVLSYLSSSLSKEQLLLYDKLDE